MHFLNCRDDANVDDHEFEHVNHRLSLAQKLNLELSQMIFLKMIYNLSKVVGQGLYNSTYIHSPKKNFLLFCRGVWISVLWLP